MSKGKGKQKGESSKPCKSSKAKESGSSSSEPETSSDTLADVKDGEGSDESGQKTIESQLDELQLAEDPVAKDGNCMFESVARQIPEMTHELLRQAACDHLRDHRTDYPQLVVNDFEKQLSEFRHDGVWANGIGDIMPIVIRDVTMREIVIIQDGEDPTSLQLEESVTNSPIVIVRRDDHFNSTKPPKNAPKNQEMLDMAPNDIVESGSSSFEPETSSDTLADVNDGGDSLVIGGLNVRSLLTTNSADKKKKNLVGELIKGNKLDILVVGESMLRESTTPRRQGITSDPLHIDDYTYVRHDRYFINENASGGLVVYIREEIEFKKRSDWEWPESNVQFVEISVTIPKRFDLVAIYSPHKDHAQHVIDLMRFFLDRNEVLNTPVMFVGDLNIEFAIDSKIFTDYGSLRQLITTETHNARCIDHIITNIPKEDMGSVGPKVVNTGEKSDDADYISDHKMVLCSVKKSPQPAALSISQPKECDNIKLQVVLSNLIKDPQTKHISLKVICEFNNDVNTDGVQRDSYIDMKLNSDGQSVSFNVTLTASNKVQGRLTRIDNLIEEIEDNNDQVSVVTKQCTICIVHKQTKSLHMSDESKPWSVGGVDCFLINCSADQIPKVEPFLRKFHVCDQQNCFMLYNNIANLKHHKMQHGCCPYCVDCIESPTELNQHIKVKHKYSCGREDCMKSFSNEKELKEHKKRHPKHVDENLNSDDNKCVLCDTSYASREQLTYHYASEHFICIQCSKQLSSKQCTVNHIERKHYITWCPDKCCRKYFAPDQNMDAHQRDFNHY